MKEIMTLTANEISMTTIEIAKQTGKRVDHVKRDTERMLLKLHEKKDIPKFGEKYKDEYGREQDCYRLPKREVLILVSGYSIPLRAAIIDRLEELEKQNNISMTKIEILEIALKTEKEKVMAISARDEALETKAHINNKKTATAMATASHLSRENNRIRPKAKAWEQLFETNNVYKLTTAFKLLDLNPYVHFQILKERKILVKYDGAFVPAERYRQNGYLKARLSIKKDGGTQAHTYVTHKGLDWLREMFCIEEELTG